jgi:FAD/FMN-containing dehydrogenase
MADVTTAVRDLSGSFSGRLLVPADAAYDDARRVHNGLIDKRPAVIAQCRGTADISDAIKFANLHGLRISVRGGGHNPAGRAVVDDGMTIDLSLMRSVAVDPATRTARVEGGATWKEFNRETQQFGLATTGGVVGSTGVAGLTLGGGFGWLMSKHGMSLDNLRAVEIVLADGRVLHVNETSSPRSISSCTPSDQWSPAVSSHGRLRRRATCFDSSGTTPRTSLTTCSRRAPC